MELPDPDPNYEYGSGGAKNALNFAQKHEEHIKNDISTFYDFFLRRKPLPVPHHTVKFFFVIQKEE
jgi:hypothetical protein